MPGPVLQTVEPLISDGVLPALLYIGPEIGMPLASGLAAVIGFVLLMWNRAATFVRRAYRFCRGLVSRQQSADEA